MNKPRGTYTPDHRQHYTTGRHPARCNKRECQARRNLTKHPALYVKWPTCHMPGCNGKMYVDWYRKKKGDKDNAPVCRDPMCGYIHPDFKRGVPMHRISTKGCSQYEKYVSERNTAPRSKHSPIPVEEWVPF